MMSPATSIFLDLIRFCAALVVALDHLADYTNNLLWQFGSFGAAVVDVFFVLSGYVIAYAVSNHEGDFTRYAVSRFARLYSVVLPALIIGLVLGIAGTALRPTVDWGDTSLITYLRCLLFTNELWFSNLAPGYNGPFRSLGYEARYYIIFAAAYFARGLQRYALTLLCVFVAGPRTLMMFPLWLMGVAAWTLPAHVSIGRLRAAFLWCVSSGLLAALVVWHWHRMTGAHPPAEAVPAMQRDLATLRPYLVDYGIGLLVAVNFLGFNSLAALWARPAPIIEIPIRWLAGATFTLYLSQVPVGQFLAAVSPWLVGTLPERTFVIVGTFSIVLLVAQYTERQEAAWRGAINGVLALKQPKSS